MTRSIKRRGFTLVELLVVTGLIVFLAAVAMLTVPGIMQKNRTVDASTQVDVWLQIARARAQRDKLPRGLRLIIDTTTVGKNPLHVTEVQYIEAPPVFVANPNPPYPNGLTGTSQPHVLSPRVVFVYTLTTGAITGRQCVIRGLTQEQAQQIIDSGANGQQARLWMPTIGTWHTITGTTPAYPNAAIPDSTNPGSYAVPVALDQYPDAQMGIATELRTYHFGIYLPPRPLLGESAMQLPLNTCIDLSAGVSLPDGSTHAAGQDYDILFAPSGQLAYTASTRGAGHVFLWIREPRKFAAGMNPLTQAALEAGGEQMIVAIKSRGITGVAPVYWPTAPTESPYFLAQKAVAGP